MEQRTCNRWKQWQLSQLEWTGCSIDRMRVRGFRGRLVLCFAKGKMPVAMSDVSWKCD